MHIIQFNISYVTLYVYKHVEIETLSDCSTYYLVLKTGIIFEVYTNLFNFSDLLHNFVLLSVNNTINTCIFQNTH